MSDNIQFFLSVAIALFLILLISRLCGWLATLIAQPRVVGEMVSGVLLGPTVFGLFFPDLMTYVFSADVKSFLYVISNLGLTIYMFLIGAEMDLNNVNRSSLRKAGLLAFSGIVPSFFLGVAVAYLFYESISLKSISPLNFAIFLGISLSITAFPMLARILQDEGMVKTKLGSLTLIAASIDDAAAWCLLAVLTAIAQAKSVINGLYTGILGVLFVLIIFYIVKPLLKKLGNRVEAIGRLNQGDFAVILLLILTCAIYTDYIGIYSVFGGFILGIASPRGKVFLKEINEKFTYIVVVFLLPIFFTFSGLNTDLTGIFNLNLLIPAFVIIVVSIIGKYIGCMLFMKKMGFSWRESSAIGGLMNARGLMLLIVLNIGLSYNMITHDLYSILVLMTVITTMLAMPIYKYSMGKRQKAGSKSSQKLDYSGP